MSCPPPVLCVNVGAALVFPEPQACLALALRKADNVLGPTLENIVTDNASRVTLSAGSKVFLAFAVVLSAVNFVDFVLHGWRIVDLCVGVGFALIAYGTYRNGLVGFGSADERIIDRPAQYASGIGVVLALGAFVAERVM